MVYSRGKTLESNLHSFHLIKRNSRLHVLPEVENIPDHDFLRVALQHACAPETAGVYALALEFSERETDRLFQRISNFRITRAAAVAHGKFFRQGGSRGCEGKEQEGKKKFQCNDSNSNT